MIYFMHDLDLGQFIRRWGPKLHEHKSGTPTMGGVALLVGFGAAGGYLWFQLPSMREYLVLVFVSTFGFGLIGFVDDILSLFRGRSLGLIPRQKMLSGTIISVIFVYLYFRLLDSPHVIDLPFSSVEWAVPPVIFYVFALVVLLGTVNALNLTDGLDGLAAGASVITLSVLSLAGPAGLLPVTVSVIAAGLAFLWYNFHPAKIFMGDTGAFALGGFIAALALITQTELYVPFFGGLFFLEALSVIIQVSYYKITERRIFKISPFHHHFEAAKGVDYEYLLPKLEWPEELITIRLLTAHALMAGVGVFALLYR